jgi:hypothetical protein
MAGFIASFKGSLQTLIGWRKRASATSSLPVMVTKVSPLPLESVNLLPSSPAVAEPLSNSAKAVENTMKVITFFESIGAWLKAHFTKLPAAEVQVSSVVNYVAPFVEELDTLVDPTLAPIINPIIDKIKTGLAALAVTIKAAATPAGTTNIQSIVASLAANAAALEAAFQVKDAATQTKVTGIITLISGEFTAIQQQFGTPAATA